MFLALDPFFPDFNPDTRPVANPPFTSLRFRRAYRLSLIPHPNSFTHIDFFTVQDRALFLHHSREAAGAQGLVKRQKLTFSDQSESHVANPQQPGLTSLSPAVLSNFFVFTSLNRSIFNIGLVARNRPLVAINQADQSSQVAMFRCCSFQQSTY